MKKLKVLCILMLVGLCAAACAQPAEIVDAGRARAVPFASLGHTCLVSFRNVAGEIVKSEEYLPGEPIREVDTIHDIVINEKNFHVSFWYDEDGYLGGAEPGPFDFAAGTYKDVVLRPWVVWVNYVFFISEGTQVPHGIIDKGDKVAEPAAPTRSGYAFKHWSKTPGGADAYDFDENVYADALFLYAVWEPDMTTYELVYWVEKPDITGDPGTDIRNYRHYRSETRSAMTGSLATHTGSAGLEKITAANYFGTQVEWAEFSHGESAVVRGDGGTAVNVFFKRVLFSYTFDLSSDGNGSSAWVQNNSTRWGAYISFTSGPNAGQTWGEGVNFSATGNTFGADPVYYRGRYTMQAKYEQDVSGLYPSSANAEIVREKQTRGSGNWGSTQTYRLQTHEGRDGNSNRSSVPFTGSEAQLGIPTLTADYLPISGTRNQTLVTYWHFSGNSPGFKQFYFECLPGQTGTAYSGRQYVAGPRIRFYNGNTLSGYPAPSLRGFEAGVRTGPAGSGSNRTFNFYYVRQRYGISFNTMGGTAIPGYQGVMFEEPLASGGRNFNITPQKAVDGVEYIFDGWYLDNRYVEEFDTSGIMPAYDLVLFAKWIQGVHDVDFYGDLTKNELLESAVVERETAIDPSDAPFAPGEIVEDKGVFDGWHTYLAGTRYTTEWLFDTKVIEDISLHAVWESAGFTVRFEEGGYGRFETGSKALYINIEAGQPWEDAVSVPKVIAGEGYYFRGWDTAFPATVDEDITLTALYALKEPVTIKPKDMVKTYDGTPLVCDIVEVVHGALKDGDTLAYSLEDAAIMDAGVQAVRIGSYAVTRDGIEVTHEYSVKVHGGTLAVEAKALEISTSSGTKTYDGTPLTAAGRMTGLTTAEADAVELIMTGSQTEIGRSFNTYEIEWNDVLPSNYEITEDIGMLTVAAGRIYVDLTAGSGMGYAKTYGDGDPLTIEEAQADLQSLVDEQLKAQNLPAGAVTVGVTGRRPGEGASIFPYEYHIELSAGDTFVLAEGESVSDVVYVAADLTIGKRELTIKAADASKVFDGKALTRLWKADDNWVAEGRLVHGDAITGVDTAGSQTGVGKSANTPFAVRIQSPDMTDATDNYDTRFVSGVLTVTLKTIIVDIITPPGEGDADSDTDTDVDTGGGGDWGRVDAAGAFTKEYGEDDPGSKTVKDKLQTLVDEQLAEQGLLPGAVTVAVLGREPGEDANVSVPYMYFLEHRIDETVLLASGQSSEDAVFIKAGLVIFRRAVTLVANDAVIVEGEPLPEFTADVAESTPLVEGDVLDYALYRESESLEPGSYPILVRQGSNPSYAVTAVDGTFTILPYIENAGPGSDGNGGRGGNGGGETGSGRGSSDGGSAYGDSAYGSGGRSDALDLPQTGYSDYSIWAVTLPLACLGLLAASFLFCRHRKATGGKKQNTPHPGRKP